MIRSIKGTRDLLPPETYLWQSVEETARSRGRPRRVLGSSRRALGSSPLAITARPLNEREHVAHFLHTRLRPDPVGSTSLRQLHADYPTWCREQAVDPLGEVALGKQLRSIVNAIGLKCETVDGDVLIHGARFGS